MKHLGDITKIRVEGGLVPSTDVLIGGSPCQNLSIAGNRTGLKGEQSSLFLEQIRIAKEMREDDESKCRFMVWENVPGALSSNKGEDFRSVLEEIVHICDESISIPRPAKGKWMSAGAIMGDNYSVAWRVLDARWFGVPQRRKRIALVADFRGRSAPEILLVEESLRGNIETFCGERKTSARDFETSSGTTDVGTGGL